MGFVAREAVVLALIYPAGIKVRIIPMMLAFFLTLASFVIKFIRINPNVSGIYSRITTLGYFKDYGLDN